MEKFYILATLIDDHILGHRFKFVCNWLSREFIEKEVCPICDGDCKKMECLNKLKY
jgi:hypothetical protein